MDTAADTPRSAYSALERRATVLTVAVLLALAGIAWWSTVGRSHDMASMVQGIAGAGRAMPFAMSAWVFMSMWVTMMVAMMFPTVAPIVLLHQMVVRGRGEGSIKSIAFGAGYLIVWTAIGVAPLLILVAFRKVSGASSLVDRTGGAVLVLAGIYQFSRWKEACLRACRSPLAFVRTHDFGAGAWGSVRAGLSHGMYCLGCCWALMAVLFVVGLMNLAWMAAIATVFLAEKNWRHGVALTKVAGAVVIALGLAVILHPPVLGSITQSASHDVMTMR